MYKQWVYLRWLLIVMVIIALVGLGWKTFSSGVISGFGMILNVGSSIIKNLTQEAKEYVNNPNLIMHIHGDSNIYNISK
jgi:hypothetical protein